MKRGCLYCYSGNTDRAIEAFKGFYPHIRLVYPLKKRYRRMAGTLVEETVPLIPGYLFFETEEDLPREKLARTDYLLRLLTYTNGEWLLRGSDDRFAGMMFEQGGRIGYSKAYYDNDRRLRILDGFLKNYEDSIVRVNHRAKTAEIGITFQEKPIYLWLGFELDEKAIGREIG